MTVLPPNAGRFDDGKALGAMRTIGEVSAAYGIKPHILRYWEQQFPMLNPLKRSGGRRLYRADDVALIGRIDRLVNREGYTLKGARQVLEGEARVPKATAAPDASGTASAEPAAPAAPPVPEVLQRLRALRERLAAALDA